MILNKIPVITIDGPSGSGKGTIGRLLAKKLNWHFLESGALYRVLALAAIKNHIDLKDIEGLLQIATQIHLRFVSTEDELRILLNDEDVTIALQTEQCGNAASKIGAIPEVRDALLEQQRKFKQFPGLVTDGRDMGTVVFPDAELKFFLVADRSERANRRYNQLKAKGINVSLGDILEDLTERDFRDQNRKASPLKPAPDAILLDTTVLKIEEVLEQIMQKVWEVFGHSIPSGE